MNNTMTAEEVSYTADPLWSEQSQSTARMSPHISHRARTGQKHGLFANDVVSVTVLLTCMFVICALGVVYVAAYAHVMWQSYELNTLDTQLSNAASQHETLVNRVTVLRSDHRISQLAPIYQLSQNGSSRFIDVPTGSNSSAREVASAL